jgi:multiple stress resistance protein BhsA
MYKDVTKVSRILKGYTIIKTILLFALFMSFGAVNIAMASQEINHSEGKGKIGVISVSDAYVMDDLASALAHKADLKGATYFKVLSVTGSNKVHGAAGIYK